MAGYTGADCMGLMQRAARLAARQVRGLGRGTGARAGTGAEAGEGQDLGSVSAHGNDADRTGATAGAGIMAGPRRGGEGSGGRMGTGLSALMSGRDWNDKQKRIFAALTACPCLTSPPAPTSSLSLANPTPPSVSPHACAP